MITYLSSRFTAEFRESDMCEKSERNERAISSCGISWGERRKLMCNILVWVVIGIFNHKRIDVGYFFPFFQPPKQKGALEAIQGAWSRQEERGNVYRDQKSPKLCVYADKVSSQRGLRWAFQSHWQRLNSHYPTTRSSLCAPLWDICFPSKVLLIVIITTFHRD